MSSDITIRLLPCYSANGALSETDVQCNPDGETSACCAPGYQCVNNLYCRRGSVNKPGSCTDEDWNTSGNPACPCPPRNDENDYLSNTLLCSTESFLCSNNGDGEEHKTADCFDSSISQNRIIDYGNGLGVPTSTDAIALKAYYSGLAISTASASTATSTASSSGSTITSSTASTSATTSSIVTTESGLSSPAKIGLGVGIGVGVPLLALLAAIVFLLVRRRRPISEVNHHIPQGKSAPSSPAPEYRAVEQQQQQQQQQKSAELFSDYSVMTELPTVRPPGELRATPAELDNRYSHGR